jgi:hypothetical protein
MFTWWIVKAGKRRGFGRGLAGPQTSVKKHFVKSAAAGRLLSTTKDER